MQKRSSLVKLGIAWATLYALRAYLDPGSGSLIIQLLIAIVVGILATFRLWKARLLGLFGIKQDSEDEDINKPEQADEDAA